MSVIAKTFYIIKKRPVLLLMWGMVFLIMGVLHQLNPLFNLLFNFGSNGDSNIFDTIITSFRLALSLLFGQGYFSIAILSFTGGLVVLSLLAALLLSGGFNIINSEIFPSGKRTGFIEGVKKYFLKLTIMNFTVLLAGILYTLFMMIVTVPALVITSSWLGKKPELMATALFVDFITFMVLFFGFMFFRTFFLYWYPAIYNTSEKAFTKGKHFADKNFWRIIGGLSLFDIAFIVMELFFLLLSSFLLSYEGETAVFSAIIFIFRWVFETFFFLSFSVFIFKGFSRSEAG